MTHDEVKVGPYTFRKERDENAKPERPWRDYSGQRHPILDARTSTLADEIVRLREQLRLTVIDAANAEAERATPPAATPDARRVVSDAQCEAFRAAYMECETRNIAFTHNEGIRAGILAANALAATTPDAQGGGV